MRTRLLILGLGLLALGLWSPSLDAHQQKPGAPTCDVRLDLRYELQKTAHVTLAGQMEVAPPVVQVIMGAAGEDHWNEVTKHGKKYPGICRDDEHPYYVLVWKVTDYDATTWLYVLDNGCLVEPHVFGSNWISRNREKAIKKVFQDTLHFLAENGIQPAPSPSLGCVPPELLGPTKYKLKAEIKTGYVKCQTGASKVSVWLAVGDLTEVASPTCGEKVDVLRGGGAVWMKVRTQDGTAGYIPRAAVSDSPDLTPKTRSVAPELPAPFAPQSIVGPSAPPTAPTQRSEEVTIVVGTAFFVSEHGYILTNAHVVSSCKQIQTRDGRMASLVSDDEKIDLALLRMDGESPAIARFRLRPPPRIGDSVVAFGFPLQGILSSGGNLTTGTISAETGIGDDPRFVQISAPVQPGSSGSPLLDSSGDVIGVVEAKLDAVETLRIAGDIPQNVNFAIRASEAIKFLERNNVAYHADTADSILDLKVADIAAKAKRFSVAIQCVE